MLCLNNIPYGDTPGDAVLKILCVDQFPWWQNVVAARFDGDVTVIHLKASGSDEDLDDLQREAQDADLIVVSNDRGRGVERVGALSVAERGRVLIVMNDRPNKETWAPYAALGVREDQLVRRVAAAQAVLDYLSSHRPTARVSMPSGSQASISFT